MKNLNLSLAALTLIAAFVFTSCNNETPVVEEEVVVEEISEGVTGEFNINVEETTINWLGKKVTGEHYGSLGVVDGSFKLSNGELVSGKVIADVSSITVEDIEDAEMNAKLTGHLASEDFFNTAEYPEAVLEVTSSADGMATGTLTIKGISNDVSFPYEVSSTESGVDVTGTFMVDRTSYDIKYNSGKFFDNLGDKMIDDEFELSFKAVGTPY